MWIYFVPNINVTKHNRNTYIMQKATGVDQKYVQLSTVLNTTVSFSELSKRFHHFSCISGIIQIRQRKVTNDILFVASLQSVKNFICQVFSRFIGLLDMKWLAIYAKKNRVLEFNPFT